MYDKELKRVSKKLNRLFLLGGLQNRIIYIFGVSDNTRQIISLLRKKNLEPQNIIDNDTSKQGSFCSGIKVIGLDKMKRSNKQKYLYIIYSAYWREMQIQLTHLGVPQREILLLTLKPGGVLGLIWSSVKGKRQYDRIIHKYGDKKIFICPYTGTGDIYLIGTFWKQYLEIYHVEDYIFVVLTGACKKVAELFDIKNIELVRKKWYVASILDYYLLCPRETNIKILNDCWAQIHTNQIEWFRGYKGLYFTQMFRKYVFQLPDEVKPEHPKYKDVKEELINIFEKESLTAGHTIILSPYSNTLADLPVVFWSEIAKALIAKGFDVCTNSSGKEEPEVEGTKKVFFPLNIAPQFVEYAGYFIGIRSGFCDIISGTKAKKVILYDKQNRFYKGSAYEYFSLKGMGLCEDAIEIMFDHEKTEDAILEVIHAITSK